jgi:hypothetical protein
MCGLFALSFGVSFLVVRVVTLSKDDGWGEHDDEIEIGSPGEGQGNAPLSQPKKTKRRHQKNFHKASNEQLSQPKNEKHTFQLVSEAAPHCTPLNSVDQVTFTLVTQFSDDRMWMMEHHCLRWTGGPISVAVFTSKTVDEVLEDLRSLHCPIDQISVQTVSGYSEEDYPVNVLRNVALKAVKTSHVVYVDVDFWESTNLADTLQLHRDTLLDTKAALVIPAFQINRQCAEWRDCREANIPVMPVAKRELLDLIFERKAAPFDPTNKGGHGSTRYGDWFDQTAEDLVPIECVKSNRYEPYLVFRYCQDLPPFQEAFSGYGKNKMTWVMHLRRAGYEFWQLGESFVVHYPHLDSKSRMRWNGGENGEQVKKPRDSQKVDWLTFKRGQIDHTFVNFRKWLLKNVPDETLISMCEDGLNDDQRLWIDRDQPEPIE